MISAGIYRQENKPEYAEKNGCMSWNQLPLVTNHQGWVTSKGDWTINISAAIRPNDLLTELFLPFATWIATMAAPNHTAHAHSISSSKILHFWTNFNYCSYYFMSANKKLWVNLNWAVLARRMFYLTFDLTVNFKWCGRIEIHYLGIIGYWEHFKSLRTWCK